MIRTAHWILAASHYGWILARRVCAMGADVGPEEAERLEFPAVHLSADVLVLPDLPDATTQGWMEVGK